MDELFSDQLQDLQVWKSRRTEISFTWFDCEKFSKFAGGGTNNGIWFVWHTSKQQSKEMW